jgi:hypothetical protein
MEKCDVILNNVACLHVERMHQTLSEFQYILLEFLNYFFNREM